MDILANSARSDDGASDEEGEDRMRDLLASYYGLSNDGPANETNQEMRGSTVSSEQREREVEGDHEIGRDKQVLPTTTHYSMDSQHFQSTQYVRHLLKTSSLSALLRTDDELAGLDMESIRAYADPALRGRAAGLGGHLLRLRR